MKKFLLFFVMLLATVGIHAADKTFTYDFSAQGYENGTTIEAVTLDENVSATFDKGTNSNPPKYYTTGAAVRMYGSNTLKLSTTSVVIKSIEFTFGTGDGTTNEITANEGDFDGSAWSGSATDVTFTIGGTSGHRRIQAISVTYGEDAPAGTLTASPKEINLWGFTVENSYYNTHKAIFHVEAENCTENITYVMKSSGNAKGTTSPRITVATSGLYENRSGKLNVTCNTSKAGEVSDVVIIKSGDVEENVTVNVKVATAQVTGEGIFDEEDESCRPFSMADLNAIHAVMPQNTTWATEATHEYSMFFPKLRYFQGVVSEVVVDAAGKVTFTLADEEGDATVKVVDALYKEGQDALKAGDKVVLSGDFGDVEGELQILTSTIESIEAAPADAPSMWWGNYSNQQTSLTGNSKLGAYEVAMFVAGDGDLKGVNIAGERMQTRLYSNAKDVKVWVRKTLDGENIAEKVVENPASSGWSEAMFDTPVALPEEGAYVGYSFELASWYSDYDYTPIVRGSKVVAGGFYLKQPGETTFSDKSASGCSTSQILISGGDLKTNVASIADDMDDIVALKGSTVKVNATVTSQGTAGISSLDYTYTLDGASHDGHIDLDTPFGQMYGEQKTFELELGAPAQLGTQECEIQITKVNGEANENVSVKKTKASVNITVLAESAPRTAVAEIYVGPSKPYSPRGLVGAEQLAKTMGDKVIPVVVQSYDSPLVTPEYKAYQQYADGKLRFTSYPIAEINREFKTDPYFGNATASPYHFTANTVVEPTLSAVTEGAVSATATWADEAQTTVKISAKANFTGDFSDAAYRLGFMVIADGIKQDFNNYIYYYKGDYPDDDMEFWRNSPYSSKDITVNNMVVASTDATGISKSIPSTITAGTDYTYELELPLNQFEGQTPENFRVVALLLNNDKKVVVNAALATVETATVAVESVSIVDPDNTVLDGATYTLKKDETLQLTAVVTPENATNKNVTWEVMQEAEVITFEDGLVTAVGEGKAAVVVTTEDGAKQAFVYIYVPAPEPVKEPTTFEITNEGLDVTITPSNDNEYIYAVTTPEVDALIEEMVGKKLSDEETFAMMASMMPNLKTSGVVTFNAMEDYLEFLGLEELEPGTNIKVLVAEVEEADLDGETMLVPTGDIFAHEFTYGEGGDEADNVEWDPAPGEIDYNSFGGHLDQVILTFTDAGKVELNDIPFKANIEDETGREVDSMYGVNFFFLGMNQACITFNKGVTADGTYTVNVPAGLFTLTMPDGTTKASSELHATYIVTGAGEGPAPGDKMQILPAEGNVTSLQQFTLVINDWDSQFDNYNSKAQFYKDGELVEEVAFDYDPENWTDPNLYGSLSAPVTADGTYTLEFPVGSMTTNSWATSNTEPVVYTWTIGEGGEAELPIGTFAEPIALEEGKTYGLNFTAAFKPNFYTFESDKDVKVILTPTAETMEVNFGISTGNFLMDEEFNDLEGAEMVDAIMEPIEGDEPSIDDDFGWGMGPGRMATTWTAKAGVKYYIVAMGEGAFDVALDEPEEYVGTMDTPINLNETTEWTWGTDGKVPGSATYYTYTAEKDGNLTVFVSNCAENQLFVGEGGWYDSWVHTEGPAYTGEIKTDYNWDAWSETNTFAVEAGTTYFITIFDLYDETVKVSFEEATGIKGAAADKANGAIFNVSGQKVDKTAKGILIINGKKVLKK